MTRHQFQSALMAAVFPVDEGATVSCMATVSGAGGVCKMYAGPSIGTAIEWATRLIRNAPKPAKIVIYLGSWGELWTEGRPVATVVLQ